MKMRLLPIVIFLFLSHFNFSQIIYVDSSAVNGANTGTSWPDAYTDLQDALPANEGDVIWVAKGTYLPDEPNGNSAATFFIGNNIQLLGGFDGTEMSADEREPETNKTILSGDLNEDDVDGNFSINKFDNVMTVLSVHTSITNATLIDGFNIRNGHADGTGSNSQTRGGAIYTQGAPIISNCSFIQNFAEGRGGAVQIQDSGAEGITFENCHFLNNRSALNGDSDGGAIGANRVEGEGVIILNSTFDGNTADWGAGVWLRNSNGFIENVSFTNNVTPRQAGALRFNPSPSHSNAKLTVLNSTFEGNSAAFGGGIYALIFGNDAVVEIENSTFKDNLALQSTAPTGWGAGGGGFCGFINSAVQNTNITFDQCIFESNATEVSGGGLELFNGGNFTEVTISNCDFEKNESIYHGGGLLLSTNENANHTTMVVDSCSFSKNHVEMWTGGGLRGLFLGFNSNLTLTNSSFSENSATYGGGGAGIYGFASSATGKVNVSNNIFDNNVSGYDAGLGIGSGTDAGYFEHSISKCTLTNNHSTIDGGGLGLYNERPAKYLVEDCYIDGNTSDGAYGGLVIYNTSPDLEAEIKRCKILNNEGNFGAALGGYPFPEEPGDFMVTNDAKIVFENCLIAGNTGTSGTIGFKQIGNVHFGNCTIAENPAGGIVLDSTSAVTLQNTILYNPGSTEYVDLTGTSMINSLGGNLFGDSSIPSPHQYDSVTPNSPFVAMDDFHLNDDSPAVDKGVTLFNPPEFDLDGNPRVIGCIDIGAYENPNGNSTNCLSNTKEVNFQELEVYPNPVNTHLQIDLPEQISKDLNITIESIKGETLKNQIIQTGQSIDVSDLVPGMYFLRVDEGGVSYFSKFVKI